MDPDPVGSGVIYLDPDPEKKIKEKINKNFISNFRPVNSSLFVPGLGICSNQMSDCEQFAQIAQDCDCERIAQVAHDK